ncbi:MAG: hypothetical protein DDT27_00518 [Dehalococcoidia bacterium]|nr:hypothetical protein [Chloroflexota bacterium]
MTIAVVISEDGELAGSNNGRAIWQGLLPARNVIIDQLGDIGIIANNYENR